MNDFLSGALTTISVGIVGVAARLFYKDTLVPLVQQLTARGHNISGDWEATFPAKHDVNVVCTESISIYQKGNRVHGGISYVESLRDNIKPIRRKRFRFEGRYEDTVLVATYWNADRRQIGNGTFTLKTNAEGDRLVGKYSWLDPDTDAVEADDYTWVNVYLGTSLAALVRPIDPYQ